MLGWSRDELSLQPVDAMISMQQEPLLVIDQWESNIQLQSSKSLMQLCQLGYFWKHIDEKSQFEDHLKAKGKV